MLCWLKESFDKVSEDKRYSRLVVFVFCICTCSCLPVKVGGFFIVVKVNVSAGLRSFS